MPNGLEITCRRTGFAPETHQGDHMRCDRDRRLRRDGGQIRPYLKVLLSAVGLAATVMFWL